MKVLICAYFYILIDPVDDPFNRERNEQITLLDLTQLKCGKRIYFTLAVFHSFSLSFIIIGFPLALRKSAHIEYRKTNTQREISYQTCDITETVAARYPIRPGGSPSLAFNYFVFI